MDIARTAGALALDERAIIRSTVIGASSFESGRCMDAEARHGAEEHGKGTGFAGMGVVIKLAERRERRRPRDGRRDEAPVRAEFFFDLACPFSYLAAERVERAFDEVTWTPACGPSLRCGSLDSDPVQLERMLNAAGGRAH